MRLGTVSAQRLDVLSARRPVTDVRENVLDIRLVTAQHSIPLTIPLRAGSNSIARLQRHQLTNK